MGRSTVLIWSATTTKMTEQAAITMLPGAVTLGAGAQTMRLVIDDGGFNVNKIIVTEPPDADGDQVPDREDNCPQIPNPGQADYAMANEVLNKVAEAEAVRRGPGCPVKSIGWANSNSLKEWFR